MVIPLSKFEALQHILVSIKLVNSEYSIAYEAELGPCQSRTIHVPPS